MSPNEEPLQLTLKSLVFPFTTLKAIHYLILIGFVVYANCLFNNFVGDDNGQIVSNPTIHSLSYLPYFFHGSTMFLTQVSTQVGIYYKPLLSITFALLYSLFGPLPFYFHFFQLVLHLTNTILILYIFKKHFPLQLSFLLSLFFLLHPINNEAVVYIANLQEELFAFYGLLSLVMIRHNKLFYLTPILLLLSLLSKETGVIFIPLTFIYYLFFIKKTKQHTYFLSFALSAVIVSYLLLRIVIGNTGINTQFLYMSTQATLLQRVITIPSVITYYAKILLYPINITFGSYWVNKAATLNSFYIPLSLILFSGIGIFSPLYYLRTFIIQRKLYTFFLLVFLMSLGLVLQIFPLDLTVADRWFYMPLFGLLGMCGVLLSRVPKKYVQSKKVKITFIITLIFVLITYACIDMSRNTNWSDSYTLCKHDEKINSQSYILEFCLSNELYNRSHYSEAAMHAIQATRLFPTYFLSWYTLGKIYYARKDTIHAEQAFRKSLDSNDFGLGSAELALLLVYDKRTNESRKIITKYQKINPSSAQLWYALALTNYHERDYNQATAAAKRAYTLEPTALTEKLYRRLANNLPINF